MIKPLYKNKHILALLTLPLTLTLAFLPTAMASQTQVMTLDHYLAEVKDKNAGVRGLLSAAQAGPLRSQEGQLLLAPTVFASAQAVSDSKLPQFSFLSYDNQITKNFSFGVAQNTSFGLQAKLHYDIFSQYYTNPALAAGGGGGSSGGGSGGSSGAGSLVPFSYTNASPVFEISQSLWSNGFGRGTRALQDKYEAQALASGFSASYAAKADLSQAETAYWRLAVARQTVNVQQQALDRAKKIYEWNNRRARLQLTDRSDLIQADTLVRMRELELTSARNEERSASRAFNTYRNVDSNQVEASLPDLGPSLLNQIQVPERSELRDDVKAAQQSRRATVAESIISLERISPTLNVFGSLALNGQRPPSVYGNVSDSINASFSLNRPTGVVGLKFELPFDFEATQNSREGWRKEQAAAEMHYDRLLFEQEQGWKDLNENLSHAKEQLELSRKLESIQESKLEYERQRLQKGRTTTYQVLLFEQDYLLSQLNRIRDQAKILNIIAQMKTYGESL